MPRGRTRRSEDIERDAEALRLRHRGMEYWQIAKALDIDVSTAYRRVQRALKDTLSEAAEHVREMELARLDRYQREVERILAERRPAISQGRTVTDPRTGQPVPDEDLKLKAIDRGVRISKRRSELLGLDMPTRVQQEVTVVNGDIDAEIRRLSERIGRAVRGEEVPKE